MGKVYVTENYLSALLPSGWEIAFRLLTIVSAPVMTLHGIFWLAGLIVTPRFALIGAATFIPSLICWLALSRKRRRMLANQPPTPAEATDVWQMERDRIKAQQVCTDKSHWY